MELIMYMPMSWKSTKTENSPAIMINDRAYSNLTPERVRDIIKQYIREEV